jgi:hypothetical protein
MVHTKWLLSSIFAQRQHGTKIVGCCLGSMFALPFYPMQMYRKRCPPLLHAEDAEKAGTFLYLPFLELILIGFVHGFSSTILTRARRKSEKHTVVW